MAARGRVVWDPTDRVPGRCAGRTLAASCRRRCCCDGERGFRGAVGVIPLARLRSHHLDDLLHERQAAGAAPATLNNLRAQLRTVFAKAKKAGRWFGDNPLDSIERRKVPKRVYRTLSPEQMGLPRFPRAGVLSSRARL